MQRENEFEIFFTNWPTCVCQRVQPINAR